MSNAPGRQTPRFTDVGPQKGSGRGLSSPSDRADQASIKSQIVAIEHEILSHPSLAANIDVVSVYLTIGKYQLEPISWLRQEGLWKNMDPMVMHELSLRLPRKEHYEALRDVQPSLFDNPPSDLFDLICQYRWLTAFEPTDILSKLDEPVAPPEQRQASKYEAGRTAPDGYKYSCPSRGCRKQYAKSGHLKNHINQNHPDFLRLHPDWRPFYRPVEAGSSDSSSPASERHPIQQLGDSRPSQTRRPVSADWASTVSESIDLPPGSPMTLDFGEGFNVIHARYDRPAYSTNQSRHERSSHSQRRPTSLSVDVRRGSTSFATSDLSQQLTIAENEGIARAARRHSGRQPPRVAREQSYGSER